MKWTLYICWGNNAGFIARWNKQAKGLVLWKLAFGLVRLDIEEVCEKFSELLKNYGDR